jgi:hypothetical protein
VKTAQELAQSITTVMGGAPRRHGREWRVFCPVHEADGGGHRPSLGIWDKAPGVVRWKCMTGCPRDAVREALKAKGVALPGQGGVSAAQQLAAAQANETRRQEALVKAYEALAAAEEIEHDDPVAKYLTGRRLGLWWRGARFRLYNAPDPIFAGAPSMLGPIVDLTTARDERPRVTGIMTLSLTPEGAPRLQEGKKLRSIAGTQKGFGVALGNPGRELVVAEGVESCLAAMELLGVGFGVATLSASNMPFLAVPPWVSKVTVAMDNDAPGRAAAAALRQSLDACGMPSAAMGWEGPDGWDANDELMKRRGS